MPNEQINEQKEERTDEAVSGLECLWREKKPVQFDEYLSSTYYVPGTAPAAKGHRKEQDRRAILWPSGKRPTLTEGAGDLAPRGRDTKNT